MRDANQRRGRLLLAMLATVVAIAACDLLGAGVDPGVDALGDWELEAATLDGRPIPLLAAHPVTLVVESARVSGTSACNAYGGVLEREDRSFRVSELSSTAAGCEPEVLELEEAYLQALSRVERASRLEDRLLLAGNGVELRFAALSPVDIGAIVGVDWQLDALIRGDVAEPAGSGVGTLRFAEDGSLKGSTGCRTFTGEYVTEAGTVRLTQMATQGECRGLLAAQDSHVMSVIGAIGDGFRATRDGDRLTLTGTGSEGLVYGRLP